MAGMGVTVATAMFALAVLVLLVAASRGGGRRARRSTLAAAKDGETVELTGVVRQSNAALRAPLGGEPCCGYTVEVRRQGDAGWAVVHELSQAEALQFEDATAKATLDARVVKVDGARWAWFEVPPGDPPAAVAQFVAAEGLTIEPGMVVTQATVHDGDEVRVTGTTHREPGARDGSYRVAAEGWVIREPPSRPLSITVISASSAVGL